MRVEKSELQVADGLAADFDLGRLNYGLLIHIRLIAGAGTKDTFEYRSLVGANNRPLSLPGVREDDDRIEFERGHCTPLDRKLVRRSAFAFGPAFNGPEWGGAVQQVYLIVKPLDDSVIERTLGLTWLCGVVHPPIRCPPEGLPPIRLWCTEEWHREPFVFEVPYGGKLQTWVDLLFQRALAIKAVSVFSEPEGVRGMPDLGRRETKEGGSHTGPFPRESLHGNGGPANGDKSGQREENHLLHGLVIALCISSIVVLAALVYKNSSGKSGASVETASAGSFPASSAASASSTSSASSASAGRSGCSNGGMRSFPEMCRGWTDKN